MPFAGWGNIWTVWTRETKAVWRIAPIPQCIPAEREVFLVYYPSPVTRCRLGWRRTQCPVYFHTVAPPRKGKHRMHYALSATLWYMPSYIFLEYTSESTPTQTSLGCTEMAAQLTRQVFRTKLRSQRHTLMCGFLAEQIWAPAAKRTRANETTAAMFVWEINLNPEVKVW